MRTPLRLGLYGALLVLVFALAYVTAGAVVPEQTVRNWNEHSVGDHDAHDR